MAISKEAKEARNKYMKEYRLKNKQKIKEISDRYWEKQGKK